MFEKVNPYHPDKVADRIAGAITDIAYKNFNGYDFTQMPKIATEVLIGHGTATIIIETSLKEDKLNASDVLEVMRRICPAIKPEAINIRIVAQDSFLAANQIGTIRCGDNGIFKGMLVTNEQHTLTEIARELTNKFNADGKYIIKYDKLIICQSNASLHDILMTVNRYTNNFISQDLKNWRHVLINPLGPWTGGTDVDSGATNRKLGSDMGDAVTGGGLHGKDLSKADVSVNIVCHLLAQTKGKPVEASCAIGDDNIEFRSENGDSAIWPYKKVVMEAYRYITQTHGSFEKFAEWGLIK